LKASKVIENLVTLIAEHGDLMVLDDEELEYSIGDVYFDKKLNIFRNKINHIGNDADYVIACCEECCGDVSTDKIIHRFNGIEHKLCTECFFENDEYTLYTENAYYIENGEKKYILKDGTKTDLYYVLKNYTEILMS